MHSSDTQEYPQAAVAWRAVVVLLLFYALAMVDRQILSLMVGPIRQDLQIDDFKLGLLQGFSFALLYCLCGIPLGYAVDRISRRLVIFGGVLIWALATSASGLATTYSQLFAARFFVGMGEAALAPAAFSILSDIFPRHKLTFALSVYSMGALLGNACAFLVGGAVIQAAATGGLGDFGGFRPWQAVFLLLGLPGIPLAFLIFAFPEPARRSTRADALGWRALIAFMAARRRFFACHFGGFSCLMILAYATTGWQPTYLIRTFGWSVGHVGAIMAPFHLGVGVLCFAFSGRVVEWLWNRGYHDAHMRFYVGGTLVTAVCGTFAFLAATPLLHFVMLGFAMVAVNLAGIASSSLQMVTPAELRGRVSAIYLLVTGLAGMILGPSIVSFCTTYVLAADEKLYLSLALTYAVLSPLACLFFWAGMKPMRAATLSHELAQAQAQAQARALAA